MNEDKKPNNPPAFAKSAFYHSEGGADSPQEGMTLRDYFANTALLGIMISSEYKHHSTAEQCADGAYKIADAMLKHREVTNETP